MYIVAHVCEPEPLSDSQLNEAAIAVQVFGTYTVSTCIRYM